MELYLKRTKNKMVGSDSNIKKMCQVGRRRSVSKQLVYYTFCALTFFQLATYNQNGLFCNAIPPVSKDTTLPPVEDVVYDSDITTDTQRPEEDTADLKEDVASSSSYMDHKGLFCGSRMSDLLTLNVTAR